MDFEAGLERSSNGAEPRSTIQGDSGAHYSGGLLDLLMSEHCFSPENGFDDEAHSLGSGDSRIGLSMPESGSRVFRQASRTMHSNITTTQPFHAVSDRNCAPGFSNSQARRGEFRHSVIFLTCSMEILSCAKSRIKGLITLGAGFLIHLPPINQAIPTHSSRSVRQHRRWLQPIRLLSRRSSGGDSMVHRL